MATLGNGTLGQWGLGLSSILHVEREASPPMQCVLVILSHLIVAADAAEIIVTQGGGVTGATYAFSVTM